MQKIREWKRILLPYEQAVEELKVKLKSIRNEFRDMNEYSPIEFVTGRVKKISSILEKASRSNIPEDRIEEEIEDIAGIRIMCQFVDDIYRVVKLIRKRSGKDLEVVYEKDYIKNNKESGYRSYHVIIRYPVQTALGEKKILAEIQIRTLAMNFWATAEHSLNYKYKKNIPENIRERLRKAAEAAYQLDKEMLKIRNEIITAQRIFEEKSNSVYEIANNIHLLSLFGYKDEAKEFQEKFDKIWKTGSLEELQKLSETIKFTIQKYHAFD
ncbi:GTP pyrophosphokinase [Maledivibacter halophilus]|uniref:Putative GTP pyrophosphokinase n=1 Tax=Maledivibacter halophilus TaxID=36842 RepID=A0A1T5M773_9FIRM|nr:GTP pyrophosphokinase family protein [Maledivibacter halophilus]SKC84102.1 putative GTP pyrophosphokinase [Maledivibacter halophilus]